MDDARTKQPSGGFEQGPIRPPSEATSLLIRVTRNCHWNRCAFCPVYKGKRFSRRSVGEVLSDIRAMKAGLEQVRALSHERGHGGELPPEFLVELYQETAPDPERRSLLVWLSGGGRTAFLQDADCMVVKPDDLARILRALRETFPSLERVTCYARSQTLARRTVADLALLKEAGLDRVHVGLESGSDRVLRLVRKGCRAGEHVRGGRRVIEAGLELSEYVIPGLGGRSLSVEHAGETARVLSEIDPHFIRLRTLAVPDEVPLADMIERGEFTWPWETEIVAEIRSLIEQLEGIGSRVVSDHILNLLMEIEGNLPQDRDRMLALLDRFLSLEREQREVYIVGRRSGLFRNLGDMADPMRRPWAEERARRLRLEGSLERVVRGLVKQFI